MLRSIIIAIGWLILLYIPIVTTTRLDAASSTTTNNTPPPNFIAHAHAGFSSYILLTDTVSLDTLRPLFVSIKQETDEYIWGTYKLSGQNREVGLLVLDNLVLAYHPQGWNISRSFDCPTDLLTSPAEKATLQIATALNIESPTRGLYDFRHPEANQLTRVWHSFSGFGEHKTTITLPLTNSYLERGYLVCAANRGNFRLNEELILDIRPPFNAILTNYQPLSASHLRAGQDNLMETTGNLSFGSGIFTGIAVAYAGDDIVTVSGNNHFTRRMGYPDLLGDKVEIFRIWLPIMANNE